MEVATASATTDEAHVSKRPKPFLRSDDQQAQPGDGNGGGYDLDPDLISQLPDAILGTVISFLPTKDGARTQALSLRWLPLWLSPMAPLNLVADYNLSGFHSRDLVVSKILSNHPGPARRFSVIINSLWSNLEEVGGWLCSESLAGLEELQVTSVGRTRYLLQPHALIRFAPTLRVLDLRRCRSPASPSFPRLKQLILFDVAISEDSLQSMISSCTVLESISIHKMGFPRLCISSPTLRSIIFYAPRSEGLITFQELVIEDAPCLERLLPFYPEHGPATIRVIQAPKLEMLGFLSQGISTLHLGTTVFQKMIAVRLTTKMYTVKILALESSGSNLGAVVEFLKCFVRLEKLYVILPPGNYWNHLWKYAPLDPIECLELSLQEVVLKNYHGHREQRLDALPT